MSKFTSTIFPAIAGATSVCASLARLPVASMYAGIGITTACAVVTSTIGVSAAAVLFAALDPLDPLEMTAKNAMQPKMIPKTPRFPMITFDDLAGFTVTAYAVNDYLREISRGFVIRN